MFLTMRSERTELIEARVRIARADIKLTRPPYRRNRQDIVCRVCGYRQIQTVYNRRR